MPIYFVVSSSVLLPADVEVGKQSAAGPLKLPNIKVVHIETFLKLIASCPALDTPDGFVSAIDVEQNWNIRTNNPYVERCELVIMPDHKTIGQHKRVIT